MEVLLFEALEGHTFQVLGNPAGCGLLDFDVFVARPFDDPLKMTVTPQVLRLEITETKNNIQNVDTKGFAYMYRYIASDLVALLENLG